MTFPSGTTIDSDAATGPVSSRTGAATDTTSQLPPGRNTTASSRRTAGVTSWEAEHANRLLNCIDGERTTWLAVDDTERAAPAGHDCPTLFDLGAHPFLTLTLYITTSRTTKELS